MTNEKKPEDDIVQNDQFDSADDLIDDVDATHAEEAVSLEQQLEAALEEVAQLKDRYVRAEAEMMNLRRRTEKDVENAHKFGQEKLSKELLAVADNLERAVQSTDGDAADVKAIREGVVMTLQGLCDVFNKFNIIEVNPEGEPFDPQLHQAMSIIENPEVEPNTVIAVLQKGYQLNGRLIRPAMVMVSKASDNAPKIDEKA